MPTAARRSRRTRNESPEIVPPKSDDEQVTSKVKDQQGDADTQDDDDKEETEDQQELSEGENRDIEKGRSRQREDSFKKSDPSTTARRSNRTRRPTSRLSSRATSPSTTTAGKRRGRTPYSSDDQRSKDEDNTSYGEGSEGEYASELEERNNVIKPTRRRPQRSKRTRRTPNPQSTREKTKGDGVIYHVDEGDEDATHDMETDSGGMTKKKGNEGTEEEEENSSDNEPLSILMKRKKETLKRMKEKLATSPATGSSDGDDQNEEPPKRASDSAASSLGGVDDENKGSCDDAGTIPNARTTGRPRRQRQARSTRKANSNRLSGDEKDSDALPTKKKRRHQKLSKTEEPSIASSHNEENSDGSMQPEIRLAGSRKLPGTTTRPVSPRIERSSRSEDETNVDSDKEETLTPTDNQVKSAYNETAERDDEGDSHIPEESKAKRQARSRSNSHADDEASIEEPMGDADSSHRSRRSQRKRRKPHKLAEDDPLDKGNVVTGTQTSQLDDAEVEIDTLSNPLETVHEAIDDGPKRYAQQFLELSKSKHSIGDDATEDTAKNSSRIDKAEQALTTAKHVDGKSDEHVAVTENIGCATKNRKETNVVVEGDDSQSIVGKENPHNDAPRIMFVAKDKHEFSDKHSSDSSRNYQAVKTDKTNFVLFETKSISLDTPDIQSAQIVSPVQVSIVGIGPKASKSAVSAHDTMNDAKPQQDSYSTSQRDGKDNYNDEIQIVEQSTDEQLYSKTMPTYGIKRVERHDLDKKETHIGSDTQHGGVEKTDEYLLNSRHQHDKSCTQVETATNEIVTEDKVLKPSAESMTCDENKTDSHLIESQPSSRSLCSLRASSPEQSTGYTQLKNQDVDTVMNPTSREETSNAVQGEAGSTMPDGYTMNDDSSNTVNGRSLLHDENTEDKEQPPMQDSVIGSTRNDLPIPLVSAEKKDDEEDHYHDAQMEWPTPLPSDYVASSRNETLPTTEGHIKSHIRTDTHKAASTTAPAPEVTDSSQQKPQALVLSAIESYDNEHTVSQDILPLSLNVISDVCQIKQQTQPTSQCAPCKSAQTRPVDEPADATDMDVRSSSLNTNSTESRHDTGIDEVVVSEAIKIGPLGGDASTSNTLKGSQSTSGTLLDGTVDEAHRRLLSSNGTMPGDYSDRAKVTDSTNISTSLEVETKTLKTSSSVNPTAVQSGSITGIEKLESAGTGTREIITPNRIFSPTDVRRSRNVTHDFPVTDSKGEKIVTITHGLGSVSGASTAPGTDEGQNDNTRRDENLDASKQNSQTITDHIPYGNASKSVEFVAELLSLPRALEYKVKFGPSLDVSPKSSIVKMPIPMRSLDTDKLKRVKAVLYATGSQVHRGAGFERIFSEYWDAMALRLSDRLSSHTSERCQNALDNFLVTSELRKLHNKLILSIMKRAARSIASYDDISPYIPVQWRRRVSKILHKPNYYAKNRLGAVLSIPKLSYELVGPIYRELWGRHQPNLKPIGNESRRQKTAISPTLQASCNIPGALTVDPLIRRIAEEFEMQVSELAVWMMVVAVKELATNVLKVAVSQKEGIDQQELVPRSLKFPNILASATKPAPKKEAAQEPSKPNTTETSSHTQKKLTVLDVHTASSIMPYGNDGSMGGSVSRNVLERSLHAAYDHLPVVPNNEFVHVQHFITEQIFSDARTRIVPLKAREEERGAGIVENFQDANATTLQNSFVVPPPAPATSRKVEAIPVVQAPSTTQPLILDVPVNNSDLSPPVGDCGPTSVPRGMGRAAKDLAALIRRTSVSTPPEQEHGENNSNLEAMTSKPDETTEHGSCDTTEANFDMDDGTGQRRGKGFGIKNLAAMRARAGKKDTDPTTLT